MKKGIQKLRKDVWRSPSPVPLFEVSTSTLPDQFDDLEKNMMILYRSIVIDKILLMCRFI